MKIITFIEMLGSPSPTNEEPSGYCDQLNDSNSQDSMEIESEEDLDSSEKVSNILQSADTADASPIIDGPSVSHTQCLQNLNQDNFSDAENDETAVDCYSSGKLEKILKIEKTKKLWYIVKLAQKPEAVVVPGFWLNFDRKECAWPQTNTEYVIQNDIVNRVKPSKNWVTRGVTDILGYADSFDEAVMKQQRAWEKENRGIKRTAGQTNLNDDGKRKNLKKTAPTIVTEERVNLDVDPSNAQNFLKLRPCQRLALTEIKNLKEEDKIVYVAKMLHEVLRNQAEEKLQNERRQVMIPTSSNGSICSSESSAIRSRFPIDSLKDFIKFNDDLRDGNYVMQVRNYLRTIGGRRLTKHDITREKLASILTDKVAIHYNFCGTNRQLKKKPFSTLRIWDLIHNEVVDFSYQTKEADDTCKTWLKQAKKRMETTAKKLKTRNDKDKEHEGEQPKKRNQQEAQENQKAYSEKEDEFHL
ncbi:uncharacterized protein LOC116418351 [Nasonia vitripennis]|uniref:DUF4806 domain-containing protein n=1 Tax=Nasonia vitripennis TaxID=7425 RepID=A0A7M7QMN7_NASVI|nr:uncharacterized protein LOC116418351 [Nasonia vitripennis]